MRLYKTEAQHRVKTSAVPFLALKVAPLEACAAISAELAVAARQGEEANARADSTPEGQVSKNRRAGPSAPKALSAIREARSLLESDVNEDINTASLPDSKREFVSLPRQCTAQLLCPCLGQRRDLLICKRSERLIYIACGQWPASFAKQPNAKDVSMMTG